MPLYVISWVTPRGNFITKPTEYHGDLHQVADQIRLNQDEGISFVNHEGDLVVLGVNVLRDSAALIQLVK